ncbi:MAG TPA: NAD-dependent epimerase/dehydratase family protein [Acidimicrobiales bacterium]|nr:NAD-dependent epimerase/dehydratase family protein [Acidimicrobiales bacterium]
MKVVVTGGAGFIGANLCRILADRRNVTEVVAFDNLSTGYESNLDQLRVELVTGDIGDPDALVDAFEGADAVVHLAARPSVPKSVEDPVASHVTNTTGTLNVLEAVRATGGPHLVVASSSSVYGSNPTLPKSEDLPVAPMSPYAAQKLATEQYSLAHAHSYDLDVLAFRFFNVFGPLQPAGHAYAAVIPAFVSAALAGDPIPVHGDGLQSRDFTYVDSVAAVIADAIEHRISSPTPVNLAFGSRATLLDVIAEIESVLGTQLERSHQDPRVGDVRHSQADQTRLRSLFPDLTPVEFTDGLRTTIQWWRDQV